MIIAENERFDLRIMALPPVSEELDLSRRGSCGRICALCPMRSQTCASAASSFQPAAKPSP